MKTSKEFLTALTLALVCGGLHAKAPLPVEIEDPECLSLNKEPDHATLMPYASLKEALAANRHASSFSRSLNGPWKFHWVAHPDNRPEDFYKTEFDDSAWKEIPVPSNWQLHGYGTPYYRNIGYTFKNDWPRVMSEPSQNYTAYNERNPVGSYRRTFEVPATWENRRVFLNFDGVDAAFFLWINGKKVGYNANSRNAAEFDITPFLVPGRNLVAVEVYRYCAGSYLEDQDMWRLSGIFRNVTLWSAPSVHVRDFFIKTDLDAKYQDAALSVSAKIRNYGSQPAPARTFTVTLHQPDGKPVEGAVATAPVPALNPGEETTVKIEIPVKAPAKWTAETPNLYTTVLALSGGGQEEILSTRTGFREIELKNRLFLVNGVPIKLKGVNRHENEPDTGHYVTEERMLRDLEIIKQGNCNHVRTSHYSNDPRWYELCDEWGIYLNAEANVECHGLGALSREPKSEKAIVGRNIANVENFKNHASVIIWSMGNECNDGGNMAAAVKAVKALDPGRPTHYEGFGIRPSNPADIDSGMYVQPHSLERFALDKNLTKPLYECEFAHAMFNSMGSLDAYNDIFDKYPAALGGAIWEYQDQGIWNRRDPNRQFIAFGGGFGEFPNDRYFIHKGVVFSDRSPKPHYPEMKRVFQWIGIQAEDLTAGKIRLRNKYSFISLQGFKGHWIFSEDGREIRKGDLEPLDLAPGAEKTIHLPVQDLAPKPGAVYHARVSFTLAADQCWAKAGYEIAAAQFLLPAAAPAVPAPAAPVQLAEDLSHIRITGKDFAVVFDKKTGLISDLMREGKNLLLPKGGPALFLWRAPHRKDDMWAHQDWERSGIAGLQPNLVDLKAEKAGPSAVRVESVVRYDGKGRFKMTHTAVYTIGGDGSIIVDNAVSPQGRRFPIARLGVRLQLDPAWDQFAYLGRGPMENYSDRKQGSDVGLYTSTVREQLTPYAKPMECGNHEDVRWAAVSGKNLPALMALADGGPLQVSALPYTDEVMAPVEYSIDLPKSVSTVLVLASKTLGVGSHGCGPKPMPPYIVWAEPAAFSYVLRLLPAGTADLAAAGRLGVVQDRVKPVPAPVEQTGAAVRGKVIDASSFEPREGELDHVVDGNVQTFWHSRWSKDAAQPPHHLVIDYGRPVNMSGLTYLARSDSRDGQVKDYEIYLSDNGKDWDKPVARGSFNKDSDEETVQFSKPVKAQYLKFVVLSEQRGKHFASIAELEIIEAE
jgi:beta-galactosidase